MNHISIKTRFAPSPTGLMHFGNIRTALFNYLYAKRQGGCFLLRIEDTDQARSTPAFSQGLLEDLQWLGLLWDEGPYAQATRQALYEEYYAKLIAKDLVYPCFCSEEALAIQRKIQLAAKQAPRYAQTCTNLTAAQRAAKQAAGIPCVLRFKVPDAQSIDFVDLIKGRQHFESAHIGDFIIRRADQSPSFIFANAIDDALMEVTHALRGDDHLTNTPRQILLLHALGLMAPEYGHFPTILGPDHKPLSKRNGSRSIQALKALGYQPEAIVNYLARLGHYDPQPQRLSLNALSQQFDLTQINHAPAHYDAAQLDHWQKLSMQALDTEACWQVIAPWVQDWVPADRSRAFAALIQPNLVLPQEASIWAKACFPKAGDLLHRSILQSASQPSTVAEPRIADLEQPDLIEGCYAPEARALLATIGSAGFLAARAILLQDPHLPLAAWVLALQETSTASKKQWYAALRIALMGMQEGPGLVPLMALLGTEEVLDRLAKMAKSLDKKNVGVDADL